MKKIAGMRTPFISATTQPTAEKHCSGTQIFIKYAQAEAESLEEPYLTEARKKTFAFIERLVSELLQ